MKKNYVVPNMETAELQSEKVLAVSGSITPGQGGGEIKSVKPTRKRHLLWGASVHSKEEE